MLYPPFKNMRLSVRTYVRPSIRASIQLSARCIFQPIFFKLGIRVDIGKECLGIADGSISTNKYSYGPYWFSFSIFGISLPIFFKLCMRVDIGKECLRNEDG